MNKLFGISVLLLCVTVMVAWYYREDSRQARESLAVYQGNNEVLLRRLKKSYADKVEADRRREELEKLADEASAFDWRVVIPADDAVLARLRKD